MANVDKRFGFRLVTPSGGSNTLRTKSFYVPSSYAVDLFIGDPVIEIAGGNTTPVKYGTNIWNPGSLQRVQKAVAGATNRVTGVITAVTYLNQSTFNPFGVTYRPASVEAIIEVCIDDDAIYEVQADSANAVADGDLGANANIVYTHAGDTVSGLSGAELNTASMTADATFQLKILELAPIYNNNLGVNAVMRVMFNLSSYAKGIAGI